MADSKNDLIPIDWGPYYHIVNRLWFGTRQVEKTRGVKIKHIFAPACGALQLSGHMASLLRESPDHPKLTVTTLNLSSYKGGEQGELVHREVPGVTMNITPATQRESLFVDDIGDSLKTCLWSRQHFPEMPIATGWVRYADRSRGIVDIWGEALEDPAYRQFPWEYPHFGSDGESVLHEPELFAALLAA